MGSQILGDVNLSTTLQGIYRGQGPTAVSWILSHFEQNIADEVQGETSQVLIAGCRNHQLASLGQNQDFILMCKSVIIPSTRALPTNK